MKTLTEFLLREVQSFEEIIFSGKTVILINNRKFLNENEHFNFVIKPNIKQ
jgi:hypothetical protein